MGTRDPRVDAYIAKSAEFARPILEYMRLIVHEGCPDVEETIKWGAPSFVYKGMLCGMAAFKQHCALGFWKEKLIGELAANAGKPKNAMGSMGRLTSLKDLPSKRAMLAIVRSAAAINEAGTGKPRPAKKRAALRVPAYLKAALALNAKAAGHFEAFTPGKRREYIEWLMEAKTDATRTRRLAQAIKWIAEGKARNWKYERC